MLDQSSGPRAPRRHTDDASTRASTAAESSRGGNWRPGPTQELLLEAALAPRTKAADAWRRWASGGRLEWTDPDDHRILPSVYLNLTTGAGDGGAPDVPHAGRLKGVYRHAWSRNQLLLPPAGKALELLEAARVPTLVLGAAALVAVGYVDSGARPIAEVAVLVPPASARTAIETIERSGWRALGAPPRDLLAVRAGWPYSDRGGGRVELRWRAFARSLAAEAPLWERSTPLTLAGAATRALAPPEQLLAVIDEAVRCSPVAPTTWVLDAAAVLRAASGGFDWARFRAVARAHGLSFSASELVAYLRARFAAEIPASEVAGLCGRTGRSERALHRALVRPSPGVRHVLLIQWQSYRALASARPGNERAISFREYMLQRANVASVTGLLRRVIRERIRHWPPWWLRARGADRSEASTT